MLLMLCFMWGVSLTHPMLFYVRSFSHAFDAISCREFLLNIICYFIWGVSLTHPLLFYVGDFSYMPHVISCVEFLLHAS